MGYRFWQGTAHPIGVEVDATGVRLIQVRKGRAGWHVVAAAEQRSAEPWPDHPGQREEVLAQAIGAAMRSAPFEGAECVSCLSPGELMVRAARMPKMSDDELEKAALWEASERFGLEVDQLEVAALRAGEVTQGDDVRDEIILIAAAHRDLNAHLDALLACRLLPIAVDSPYTALSRALGRSLRRESDQSVVRLIINIGWKDTVVSITSAQEISFLKHVAIGGAQLTDAVAEALAIDPEAARHLRRKRLEQPRRVADQPMDPRVDRAVFEAVRTLLHDLAQEAALCLRYHSVTFRGARPDKVLVAGTEAREPMLADVLSEHLKLEVATASPLEGIDVSKVNLGGDRRRAAWPEWTVALGLSLRGLQSAGALLVSAPQLQDRTSDEKRDAA